MSDSSDRFNPVFFAPSLRTLAEAEPLFQQVTEARDMAALQTLLTDFAQQQGFKMAGHLLCQRNQQCEWTTLSINYNADDLNDVYMERELYRVDPSLHRAMRESLPIPWGLKEHRKNLNSVEELYWAFHDEVDSHHGLLVPVHGPGYTSFLGVTDDNQETDFVKRMPDISPLIHFFGIWMVEAMKRLGEPLAKVSTTPRRLTGRERDCLAWAAEGKTAWETSRILNISESTVVFHLDNAKKRLEASNITQAVARAIELRLILCE